MDKGSESEELSIDELTQVKHEILTYIYITNNCNKKPEHVLNINEFFILDLMFIQCY